MIHWNVNVIGYWVIGAGYLIEKDLELSPSPQTVQKIPENYCPCMYLLVSQVWLVHELWFKRYIQKCTLSHVFLLRIFQV